MNQTLWSSAAWRAEAVSWLDARLAGAGIARTGDVEQPRIRPWATVLTAPTDHGRVWLKAAGTETAYEVRLYPLLYRIAPEHVLRPIAVDLRRSWVVLPDGGRPLREQVDGDALTERMVAAVGQYARTQRRAEPYVPEMLDAGVPDMRPEVMPQRFDEAAESVAAYAHGASDEERAAYEKMLARRDVYQRWCEQLHASPFAPSLDHNDLHADNVLGEAGEPVQFYDWGDAVVAHPFACMLMSLTQADAHEVSRLRDVYLGQFDDVAPRAELESTLDLACRVATVARALTWQRALSLLDDAERGDFALAPLHWFTYAVHAVR